MATSDVMPQASNVGDKHHPLESANPAAATNQMSLSELVAPLLSSPAARSIAVAGKELAHVFQPGLSDIYRSVLDPARHFVEQLQRELAPIKLPDAEKTTAADVKLGFSELNKTLNAGAKDKITQAELETAVGDPNITGSQAQMLVVFKNMSDRFQALDPDAKEKRITQKAIDKFDQMQVKVASGEIKEGSDEYQFVKDVEAELKRVRDVVKETNRKLFADEKNPLNSINVEDVKQGPIGNCYFYGATAAVVAADKNAIKDLIAEKDGKYVVTFPNKPPVTVGAPTDAELALYPKPGKDGVWMWVLEKAYGQHCINRPGDDNPAGLTAMLSRFSKGNRSLIPQERTEGPSFVDDGLKILTGKKVGWIWNKDQPKMEEQLADMFTEKPRRAITADSHVNVAQEKGGPVRWHTYSVLDYDAKSKTITLRNPWGHSPPTVAGTTDLGNGRFSMNMDTFCKYFSKINYVEK
jgi:hypothetical protein